MDTLKLQSNEILELLNIGETESPSDSSLYELAFEHIQGIDETSGNENASIDGQIAVRGLKWQGYSTKEFTRLSTEKSEIDGLLNKEEEVIYNNGIAYLGAVGNILTKISSLSAKYHEIKPWDLLNKVSKSIDRSGISQDLKPIPFLDQIRKTI